MESSYCQQVDIYIYIPFMLVFSLQLAWPHTIQPAAPPLHVIFISMLQNLPCISAWL